MFSHQHTIFGIFLVSSQIAPIIGTTKSQLSVPTSYLLYIYNQNNLNSCYLSLHLTYTPFVCPYVRKKKRLENDMNYPVFNDTISKIKL